MATRGTAAAAGSVMAGAALARSRLAPAARGLT